MVESSERETTLFLGSLFHRALNELAVVKGYAQTIAHDPFLQEGHQVSARIIISQTDIIARRLSSAIDFQALMASERILDLRPCSLDQLLGDIAWDYQLREAGREIYIETEDDLPVVEIDRKRIYEVVDNLLANACKYSSAQTPVEMSARGSGRFVFVSIKDQGVGIAQEEAGLLFQPFSRLSSPQNRNIPGNGFGLFYAQKIVHMHGGKIWVESEGLGKGSTFTFTLPAAV